MSERAAVIDLGSNAVRFEIYELGRHGPERIHRERKVLRLGNGVFEHGCLNPETMPVALELFASFRRTLVEFSVHTLNAVATSAFREARDAEAFLNEIQRTSGIAVRIISGEEEATLIAKGILANESGLDGTAVLIDIGGGSTELSLCTGGVIRISESLPIGAIRGHQVFLKTNPPVLNTDSEGTAALIRYIQNTLAAVPALLRDTKTDSIVGSSGTARAIAALCDPPDILTLAQLRKLSKQLEPLNFTELCEIPGMEPNRADVILAGVITLEQMLAFFGGGSIRVSAFSLRHGLLAELVT